MAVESLREVFSKNDAFMRDNNTVPRCTRNCSPEKPRGHDKPQGLFDSSTTGKVWWQATSTGVCCMQTRPDMTAVVPSASCPEFDSLRFYQPHWSFSVQKDPKFMFKIDVGVIRLQ